MQLKSHIFINWDEIPNVSHLMDIEDSYVIAFDRPENNQTSFVAYVIENSKVGAFGSATYFEDEDAVYYYEDDDAYCYLCEGNEQKQSENRLWIEGLVSTRKGCGRLILEELERWLNEIALSKKAPRKVINVMSVNKSVSFYEKMGYEETCTGPRFAGTDNTRLIKALPGCTLGCKEFSTVKNGCNSKYECIFKGLDEANLQDSIDEITGKICCNRTKGLEKVLNVPNNFGNEGSWKEYFRVHNNEDALYKDIFTLELRKELVEMFEEYTS